MQYIINCESEHPTTLILPSDCYWKQKRSTKTGGTGAALYFVAAWALASAELKRENANVFGIYGFGF